MICRSDIGTCEQGLAFHYRGLQEAVSTKKVKITYSYFTRNIMSIRSQQLYYKYNIILTFYVEEGILNTILLTYYYLIMLETPKEKYDLEILIIVIRLDKKLIKSILI